MFVVRVLVGLYKGYEYIFNILKYLILVLQFIDKKLYKHSVNKFVCFKKLAVKCLCILGVKG